jgi:hypothetical protein
MVRLRPRIVHLSSVLLIVLSAPAICPAQTTARTLPRALDQLASEADVIVHGYVVSARVESHPQLTNLMTVVVKMNVLDTTRASLKSRSSSGNISSISALNSAQPNTAKDKNYSFSWDRFPSSA